MDPALYSQVQLSFAGPIINSNVARPFGANVVPMNASSMAISPGVVATNLLSSSTIDNERVYQLVAELLDVGTRDNALNELGKNRENIPELAPVLWHSFGVMSVLLQEVVAIYPYISPPTLSASASNRVCNVLALLQTVASHNDTRLLFLNSHIAMFVYPFLTTVSTARPFEYLRLTSLGVIGAMVKTESPEVINFLLTTDIIPLCLRILETNGELTKTVAIFILQKILLDDQGLQYICYSFDRFIAVSNVLNALIAQLATQPSLRLLKHVIRCYLRLSENPRAREALKQTLPEQLRDLTFSSLLKENPMLKKWLQQLLLNLSDNPNAPLPPSIV